jgi:hypothetical protein
MLVLWLPYGFHGGPDYLGTWRVEWLPVGFWIGGATRQLLHGFVGGHTNYMLGELRFGHGFPGFYALNLALRVTVGAQVLVLVRLVAVARRGTSRAWRDVWQDVWQDVALLAFPLALGVVLSLGRTQLGMRYLLPAFPCAIVWCSRALGDARSWSRYGGVLCLGALGLSACDTVRVAPDFMMYYNAWAAHGDAGLRYFESDMGQDKRRLAEWMTQNAMAHPTYFYWRWGSVDGAWKLPEDAKMPCSPTVGTYALHEFRIMEGGGCTDWLTQEPPDERLGRSIYIYRVDAARVARLEAERGHIRPFYVAPPQGTMR